MRPCHVEHPDYLEAAVAGCDLCILYRDSEPHRTYWDSLRPSAPPRQSQPPACTHLGKRVRLESGEVKKKYCGSCAGDLDVYQCGCGHGEKGEVTLRDCPPYSECPDFNARLRISRRKGDMKWTCGITAVPSRRGTTLPKTLTSLEAGGFESPRLFIDGEQDALAWGYLGYEYTMRWPAVHAFGNFWMGLLELYLRDPLADLYAMFQDDVLVCRNTRKYVEATLPTLLAKLGKPAYLNLITFAPNEDLVRDKGIGWHLSNQLGWGGQALVFPRDTMLRMFQSKHLVERPLGMRNGVPDPPRAWKNLDGGVVTSVKSFGGVEVVHYPSLVHHVDCESVIGNGRDRRTENGKWSGEDFDAMSWLGVESEPKQELALEVVKT